METKAQLADISKGERVTIGSLGYEVVRQIGGLTIIRNSSGDKYVYCSTTECLKFESPTEAKACHAAAKTS